MSPETLGDSNMPTENYILMICAKAQNIRSLSGHTVLFKANAPTKVPLPAVDECLAKGCAPIDPDEVEAMNAAKDAKLQAEVLALQRIMDGIEKLVLRNNSSDFTAGGRPSDRALEKLLGEKISADQRDMAWRMWREKNREAELAQKIADQEASERAEAARIEEEQQAELQAKLDAEEERKSLAREAAEAVAKEQSAAAPSDDGDDSGTEDEDGESIPGG